MVKILLADDERVLRESMKRILTAEGYGVTTVRNGEEALARFSERTWDLIILDVMMPRRNGFSTCEEIRRRDRAVPVLFLTARDDEADQVRAYGLGADDYISKTVGETLFLARVRRALERQAEADRFASDSEKVGRVTVDFGRLCILCDNRIERLSRTEADLIRLFLTSPNHCFSCQDLITAIRGEGFACEDSLIYSPISRLRRKLGPEGWRLTHKGTGYEFNCRSSHPTSKKGT